MTSSCYMFQCVDVTPGKGYIERLQDQLPVYIRTGLASRWLLCQILMVRYEHVAWPCQQGAFECGWVLFPKRSLWKSISHFFFARYIQFNVDVTTDYMLSIYGAILHGCSECQSWHNSHGSKTVSKCEKVDPLITKTTNHLTRTYIFFSKYNFIF